jgi:hypothetical protein
VVGVECALGFVGVIGHWLSADAFCTSIEEMMACFQSGTCDMTWNILGKVLSNIRTNLVSGFFPM